MSRKLPSRKLVIFLLVIALLSSLAIAASVSASHLTTMEVCASHGLGPNFQYAEGAESALLRCLNTTSTSHS